MLRAVQCASFTRISWTPEAKAPRQAAATSAVIWRWNGPHSPGFPGSVSEPAEMQATPSTSALM